MPVPSVPAAGAVGHPLSIPMGAAAALALFGPEVQRVAQPARRSPIGSQYGLGEALGLMGRDPLPALPSTQQTLGPVRTCTGASLSLSPPAALPHAPPWLQTNPVSQPPPQSPSLRAAATPPSFPLSTALGQIRTPGIKGSALQPWHPAPAGDHQVGSLGWTPGGWRGGKFPPRSHQPPPGALCLHAGQPKGKHL